MPDPFVVVTYCTLPTHPGLAILKQSLARWGWPEPRVFGLGENRHVGTTRKLAVLKDEVIPALTADMVARFVYLDAFDTVVCGPPPKDWAFGAMRGDVLFSAERNCWPDGSLAARYPVGQSRWRFLNSGGFLGSVRRLEELTRHIDPDAGRYVGGTDQLAFTDRYLDVGVFGHFSLDTRCEVFQTLAKCEDWGRYFEVFPDGRVFNAETGTHPLFFHGQGRFDMSWLPGCEDWYPAWDHEERWVKPQ